MTLRKTAVEIAREAIAAVKPDAAVKRALSTAVFDPAGEVVLVAAGKAAWRMAAAASDILGDRLAHGIVVTKYGHVEHPIPRIVCYEAGHPVPDENSFRATVAALDFVKGLSPHDTVVFLLSGGGSALFEAPLVSGDELADVTRQLLASGAHLPGGSLGCPRRPARYDCVRSRRRRHFHLRASASHCHEVQSQVVPRRPRLPRAGDAARSCERGDRRRG